ncbi:MAG TPA: hypothetical protein ACFYEK_04635 [Candidatus Wunengus sp. YC60]|jgi:hypothetical protein|uniref:hypothetical protein n=1 Tax=Candidatus Wunengus sp. YC60 TaxID=3367697 RepID=UPI0040280C55
MFKDDLALEEQFYNDVFKPWLNSRGNDSIFIRFNSESIIYESLQKKNDIDIVLDNGVQNISLSLKTVRKTYNSIFFETISNCNTGSPGWGLYSKADFIIYSMCKPDGAFVCRCFKLDEIPSAYEKYPQRYGETKDDFGKFLYKTEGRLIPWKDFKHYCLF